MVLSIFLSFGLFAQDELSISGADPNNGKSKILTALQEASAECFRSDYSGGIFYLTSDQLVNHFKIGERNIILNTDTAEPYAITEYWWDQNYVRTDFYFHKNLKTIRAFRDIRAISEESPISTGMLAPIDEINRGSVYVQMDITCYMVYN